VSEKLGIYHITCSFLWQVAIINYCPEYVGHYISGACVNITRVVNFQLSKPAANNRVNLTAESG